MIEIQLNNKIKTAPTRENTEGEGRVTSPATTAARATNRQLLGHLVELATKEIADSASGTATTPATTKETK
ncbi:hypothetical protein SAMN05421874_128129 [Nonomuraea maritima]|uniref:Uncharacterized protein n=1 Tax=Nonomuraea maritima TaxID=683260 RepID=A0A1G9MQ67_9ACTN|nr:hypothetical protein [Nonomuraea maritima]SDL76161.1 hypothetical protein SAMN05421874_128129 [Nonomuraea maritima]